jgi:hypothetical protein
MGLFFLSFEATRRVALAVMSAGLVVGTAARALGQTPVVLTEPSVPLLPAKFGQWVRTETVGAAPSYSLASVSKDALAECGEKQSKVAEYARDGRVVHVEAIQFGDRTGAYSAFTLAEQAGATLTGKTLTGLTVGRGLEAYKAVGATPNGGGAVLLMVGKTVVLANFAGGATEADARELEPLVEAVPRASGNSAQAPLLPTLVPAKGLVAGSLRYALGPVSYTAEGGLLAASVGWDKEPEAVTAQYDDERGKETLTLLLYPTPTIAQNAAKVMAGALPELKSGSARMQQKGTLLMVATGNFAGDAAQQMLGGVHLSEMTFNQDVHAPFKVVAAQTFTLLENIAILSGVLGAAAVLLGLFLGFGRAWFRVLRGKPAAVEVEFLSLHLAPQNKPAEFHRADSPESAWKSFRGGS